MKPRKSKGRFAMLPHVLLQHAAVTTLTVAHRWVLVAVTAEYNGRNNGGIVLTPHIAAGYGITSVDTLRKGLAEIERRGLVVRTDPGSYRPPRPARYAITWQPMDATDYTASSRVPSHKYRDWHHQKTDPEVRLPVPSGSAYRSQAIEKLPEEVALGTAHRSHSAIPWDRSADTSIDLCHRHTPECSAGEPS